MKAHFNKNKKPAVKQNPTPEAPQIVDQLRQIRDRAVCEQDQLEHEEFTATAAAGMIEVTMTGDKYIKSVKLSPNAVNGDIEQLQEIIADGVNAAIDMINEEFFSRIENITGGVTMPLLKMF